MFFLFKGEADAYCPQQNRISKFCIGLLLFSFICMAPTLKAGSGKDTLVLTFDISNYSTNATEFEFFFDLSSYEIAEGTKLALDLSNSWFILPGDTYEDDLYIKNDTLFLRIEKTNGSSSGVGEVARVGGLIIITGDILKTAPPAPQKAEPWADLDIPPLAGPNPYVRSSGIPLSIAPVPDTAELWDLTGKMVASNLDEIGRFVSTTHHTGIYLLRTTLNGKSHIQRLSLVE